MNVRQYYSRFGLGDPAYMVIRQATPMLVAAMRQYFTGRILDIGCGEKTKELLADSNVEEYVGLDHEKSLHDGSNVDIFGTAYEIPVLDNSFDGVLCTAVLEHLEEPQQALIESRRILKNGGHAIYTIPFFWHLHEEPRDFYRYTKFGITHLFESVGYEIVELRALSGFWITFGSEWNYYIQFLARGPLKPFIKLVVMLGNLVFPLLDRLDRKIPSHSERWTWCYLVVARNPDVS
jgi:SAM-dependent methyltransferase